MWWVNKPFVRSGCELFQEVKGSRFSKIKAAALWEWGEEGVVVQLSTSLRYHLKLWFLQFVVKLYFSEVLWSGSAKRLNLAVAQHPSLTLDEPGHPNHIAWFLNTGFFIAEPSCESLSLGSPYPLLPLRPSICALTLPSLCILGSNNRLPVTS